MTATTVWGVATKVGGIAAHRNRIGDVIGAHSFKSLALELPPDGVAIDADHDGEQRGTLVYAELGTDDTLRAVAVVDGDQLTRTEQPVYFSLELELRGDVDKHFCIAREAAMVGLSLTFTPVTLGAQPVSVRSGDVRSTADRYSWPCSWKWSDPLLARALDHLGSGLGVEHRAATNIVDQHPDPDSEFLMGLTPLQLRNLHQASQLPGGLRKSPWRGKVLRVH